MGNIGTRVTRFANYLMNLLPSNYYDLGVMEMAAKAVGILALSSGTYASEYVEFEVRRALEWLVSDRNEGRRQAAVSGNDSFYELYSFVSIQPLITQSTDLPFIQIFFLKYIEIQII